MRSLFLILLFSSSMASGFSMDSSDKKTKISDKQIESFIGNWFSDSSGCLLQFFPDSTNASVLMKTNGFPGFSYHLIKSNPTSLGVKTFFLSTCQDSAIACFDYIISGTWGKNEFSRYRILSMSKDSMTIEITRETDFIGQRSHIDTFKRKL